MVTLAHAFDIETAGPRIGRHSLMSIAACCLEIPRQGPPQVINSFIVTIAWPDGLVFDPATKAEFWDRNPDALRVSTQNAVPPSQAAHMLHEHIRHVQETAQLRRANYVVVTDNAYFDIPWIDWFLCQYTERGMPLRYNYFTGWMKAHSVVNVNERIQALADAGVTLNMQTFRATVPHDHNPLHDATALSQRYAYYRLATKPLRKRANQAPADGVRANHSMPMSSIILASKQCSGAMGSTVIAGTKSMYGARSGDAHFT